MLGLLLLLLAPLSVLTLPNPFSAGQLVFQLPISPVIEIEAAPTSTDAVQLVYQFETERFENLAVRSNGQLVLDCINEPLIYGLDPSKPTPSPTTLHKFSHVTSVLGIAETSPDIFAVIVGNWTQPGKHEPGSFSIWSLDLTGQRPNAKLITSIPGANALNGLTALAGSPEIVLAADSVLGAIWVVNIKTGACSKAIQNDLWTNTTTQPIGINGIRTFAGSLYFTVSARGLYGRVALLPNGSAAGEVYIMAATPQPLNWDDFDMDWEGNAWITTHPNALSQVTWPGKQRMITGGSVKMLQPTSARFGRGSKQAERTIYITASGDATGAGQVIAVNTCLM